MQILHNNDRHWLTVASAPQGDAADVIIYDSLYAYINTYTQHLITQLLKSTHSPIKCAIATTQRQTGVKDCGLFSIATATSFCFGESPGERCYEQSLMRGHFRQCLARGEMTPFPSRAVVARKIRSLTDIEVYCSCRLQDNEQERMVECDRCHEWFHQSCQQVQRAVFTTQEEDLVWHCCKCKRYTYCIVSDITIHTSSSTNRDV